MNEELIRQCAREAAESDDGAYPISCGIASIRLYHARHVAPLVEAAQKAERILAYYDYATDYLRDALAPFQQEDSND